MRALELDEAGELEPAPEQSELWTRSTRHPTLLVGVVVERELLYAQINQRVDQMLEAGVEEEVRRAHAAGASITARKALGFEELLSGDIEAMKRRTRNYARRQLTWMRKLPDVLEIDLTGKDARQPQTRCLRAGKQAEARLSATASRRVSLVVCPGEL